MKLSHYPDQAIYTRPPLYPAQESAMFDPARISCIEASTKSGKTASALVWLPEKAMAGKVGQNFWWAAPVYMQAKIAYRRLVRALPRNLFKANESERSVVLANGARIEFKSCEKPDNLYGDDVYALVIDEASRVKADSWHALRSTLTATKGPVRIIGNVKGRRNWFYELSRKAESGEPGVAYHRLTWRDAVDGGVIEESEVMDAKRLLPENVFKELYAAEASDEEGNPFGIAAISACLAPLREDLEPVVWGWDLAKSVDWTVGIGIADGGEVCRFVRFQSPWRDTIDRIKLLTGDVPARIDSTGVGDPVIEQLQEGFSETYEGFKFSSTSKQQIMEGLAVAIQQREITIPEDGATRAELESYEYEYTRTGVRYSAPQGMHDDCVCALALAVSKWRARKSGWGWSVA